MPSINLNKNSSLVRVNFTNRGFSKVMARNSSLISHASEEKSDIEAVASVIGEIKIPKEEPIGFTSIPEMFGLDYVGYIIEKERLNKDTGEWVKIDEYKIIGSQASSFVDTRVAYGQSYRYRVKSVVKLTKVEVKDSLSHHDAVKDIEVFEKKELERGLRKNESKLRNVDSFINVGLAPKKSSGDSPHSIELSEGNTLQVGSDFSDLTRASNQKLKDLRLEKNSKLFDSDLATGKKTKADLHKLTNKSIKEIQEKKIEYYSYYFESNHSKNWHYIDVVERVPPPPPQTVKVVPNTQQKNISIFWLKPANDQRDVVGYRIYRRNSVGQPWIVLKDFLDHETYYIDKDVVSGVPYIYALTCIDVHDIESFLSTQVQAELNARYALEKQEKLLKFVSGPGVQPTEIDLVYKQFLQEKDAVIVAKNSIRLSPNITLGDITKNFILKIRSLDTHELHEIKIAVKNTNIGENK